MLGIVAMMKENENISATEIADNFGVTSRTIKRDIECLKEMNIVKRDGNAKSGKWIVEV